MKVFSTPISFAAISSILFLISCSRVGVETQDKGVREKPQDARDIISDRPQKIERFTATLKLSEPALLTTATKKNNQWLIPSEATTKLTNEQDRVIGQLQSLSPEIKVIYRYRMILNGIAISAPGELYQAISSIAGIAKVQRGETFPRPQWSQVSMAPLSQAIKNLEDHNSVSFIGAKHLHKSGLKGQGITVGVIDTGVDYTHRMLGGSGRPDDFKSTNPAAPSPLFPNKKVVGGMDFVGTDFDAGSLNWQNQVPRPDSNPIDEAAHGTHVAGTIAGIGDGQQTYSGVAPEALIYALKVFGANGSTSDLAVIAALEYSADPNGDGDLSDRLDVVNLSLGGGFGPPKLLYNEAIENLSTAGTIVVASAGNSGEIDYIVGAPSTADEAISVAASVDNMAHNWTYPAAEFTSSSKSPILTRAMEGPISKSLKDAGSVTGELYDIGLASADLSDEQKKALKGKVALIDRGEVPFLDKLNRAKDAGAIAAVVVNNQPGKPFAMGGEGSIDFAAVMISLEAGTEIKQIMKSEPVTVLLGGSQTIEDPSMIDTMAEFSSKGPRSGDSILKPEITAPGEMIISALMGSGDKGVMFSGTSMSGPHMAGVMALMRQKFPQESASTLKYLTMNTAKKLTKDSTPYPWSLQGAGRIQVDQAATSPFVIETASLALGNIQSSQGRTIRRELRIRNLTQENLTLLLSANGPKPMQVEVTKQSEVPAGKTITVPVYIHLKPSDHDQAYTELNAEINIQTQHENQAHLSRVPVLAMASPMTEIKVDSLNILGAPGDDVEAVSRLKISNHSEQAGPAFLFNLIGVDQRKPLTSPKDSHKMSDCDLEAAGYRIINKNVDGSPEPVLQVAVKVYDPLTSWLFCEISVQIDTNGDHLADQELVGVYAASIAGFQGLIPVSLLLDATRVREIRRGFEQSLAQGTPISLDYRPAAQAMGQMMGFEHSTLAIIETPLAAIKLRPSGELAIKVATLSGHSEAHIPDDFLGGDASKWMVIDPKPENAAFKDLPEVIQIKGNESVSLEFSRGIGMGKLVAFMPRNRGQRTLVTSPQMTVIEPQYQNIRRPE